MFFSKTYYFQNKTHTVNWLLPAVLLLMVSLPLLRPAFALQSMKDDELRQVTAQTGFDLALDDVRFYFNYEQISYTDEDGADYSAFDQMAGPAQGAKMTFAKITAGIIDVDFLVPGQDINRAAHFDLAQSDAITDFTPSPLSIDITDQLPNLCWYTSIKRAGILVQLPTINIFTEQFQVAEIKMTALNRSAWNNGYNFGKIDLKNVNLAQLGGQVALFPTDSQGIGIAVDDLDLFLAMEEVRYTDLDGLWNPINDEYDNFYHDRPPEDDEAHPAALLIRDLKIDLLRINSLVLTDLGDNNSPPDFFSPGREDVHSSLHNMQHLRAADLSAKTRNEGGQALCIDVCAALPATSTLYQANGAGGAIAGVRILLPTQEIYIDQLSFSGIEFDDPLYPEDPADPPVINDQTASFGLKIEGAETAIFSGTLEVAPR